MRATGIVALTCVLGMPVGAQAQIQRTEDVEIVPWWDRSIWENPERSYPWYPPERAMPSPAEPSQSTTVPERRKGLRELTSTKEIREELDRLRDQAVINPTKENVKTYLEAQQYVMDKGSVFADVARRVVWETAELD